MNSRNSQPYVYSGHSPIPCVQLTTFLEFLAVQVEDADWRHNINADGFALHSNDNVKVNYWIYYTFCWFYTAET